MTLKEWMKAHDLNDAALAERVGDRVSRSQINRIRRGKSRPSIELARELEHVTKIPAASFVMGEAA